MQNSETYAPKSPAEWRQWLLENHLSKSSVWLVLYKKSSDKHNMAWSEAVDEALCFGWVDGRRRPMDGERFLQFFCRRKPNSTWSKINKDKVADLVTRMRMMPAGFDCINIAKQNGSWNILDDVENLVLPDDLRLALEQQTGALEYYMLLSPSVKKLILQWVKLCKTDLTRKGRITEIVNAASVQMLPPALRR